MSFFEVIQKARSALDLYPVDWPRVFAGETDSLAVESALGKPLADLSESEIAMLAKAHKVLAAEHIKLAECFAAFAQYR